LVNLLHAGDLAFCNEAFDFGFRRLLLRDLR
jgi:hypothetical protein